MGEDIGKALDDFAKAIKASFENSHSLIQPVLPLALLFLGVSHLISLYFQGAQEMAPESMLIKLFSVIGVLFADILGTMVFIFLVPLRFLEQKNNSPRRGFFEFMGGFAGTWVIEGLRKTAKVILWSLALIIPGIYVSLRWAFMSFIIAFDPEYKNGKYDPLKRSWELSKGSSLVILVIGASEFAVSWVTATTREIIGSLGVLEQIPQLLKLFTLGSVGVLEVLINAVILVYIYGVWFRFYELRIQRIEAQPGATA